MPLTIDDFQKVSDRVPYLADLKPSGKYVQEDLHDVGGTPAVMKYLLEKGLLDGDCLTVTGKTHRREPRATCRASTAGQEIVHPLENPIKPTGHIQILRGNLAPEGAVAKITGKEGTALRGPGQVSTIPKKTCSHALERKEIAKGDVVVIRYEGPKGGPGHARDAHADLGHHGRGLGQGRGADHRRPLLRRLARLHRRPRHARGPGRRPDRRWCKTATGSRSTPTRTRSTSSCRADELGRAREPPGKRRPTRPRAARSTSTSRT